MTDIPEDAMKTVGEYRRLVWEPMKAPPIGRSIIAVSLGDNARVAHVEWSEEDHVFYGVEDRGSYDLGFFDLWTEWPTQNHAMTDIPIPADVLEAARKVANTAWLDTQSKFDLAKQIARAILADRAAQAERMARLEEALTKRIEWHRCSCPEPCDDYWVFPGGCIGKYREDYRSLRALSQEGSEPS